MHRAHRIEHLLHHWEDLCLFKAAEALCQAAVSGRLRIPPVGPLAHCLELRKKIIRAMNDTFDEVCFLGEEGLIRDAMYTQLGSLYEVPMDVWEWSRSGRRVFSLDAELQFDLEKTSLADMTWRDLAWPFPAFALMLATPIFQGEVPYDCALVYRGASIRNEDSIRMTLIPSTLEASLFDHTHRRVLRRLLKNRLMPFQTLKGEDNGSQITLSTPVPLLPSLEEIRVTRDKCQKMTELLNKGRVQSGSFGGVWLNKLVTSHIEDNLCPCDTCRASSNPERLRATNRFNHLLVNVLLHLRTLDRPATQADSWRPIGPREQRSGEAITNAAQIFDLHGESVIRAIRRGEARPEPRTREQIEEEILGPRRRMTPHFRTGYWRRAPGTGHLPDAPKLVHVKWSIVNKEDLAEGELPHGNITHLMHTPAKSS